MSHLRCWDLTCQTDGVVNVWAEYQPMPVCPNNGGHTVDSVLPTSTQFNDGQPTAHHELFMDDGTGRVYRMSIDQNGAWQSTQVAGPPPA
jgi:hypothetical protein